jgi:hypothetical protein
VQGTGWLHVYGFGPSPTGSSLSFAVIYEREETGNVETWAAVPDRTVDVYGVSPVHYLPLVKSDGNWWSGLSITCTSSYGTMLSWAAHDIDGRPIGILSAPSLVSGMDQVSGMASSWFAFGPSPEGSPVGWLELKSRPYQQGIYAGLLGLSLMHVTDEKGSGLGGTVATTTPAIRYCIPHYVCNQRWDTSLALTNVSFCDVEVSIEAFGSNGQTNGVVKRVLPARGMWVGSVEDLFLMDASLSSQGFAGLE